MRQAYRCLNQINLGVFQVGALVWLLIVMWGYFDLRVNSDQLYGGEHISFAAPNKGMDFKAVYEYGTGLRSSFRDYVVASSSKAPNVYPPFVTVVMLPFTFISVESAYHMYAFLLICTLCLTVYACLSESVIKHDVNKLFLSIVITSILFNTYPVSFSVERGNSDILAAAFATLALVGMSRGRLLLSVLCLTLSIQLKVYPAVLVLLLFVRFGWKSVAGLSVLNILLLFVLGVNGLEMFLALLSKFAKKPFLWPGNHSVYSYIDRAARAGVINPESSGPLRSYVLYALLFLTALAALRYYINSVKARKMSGRVYLPFTGMEIGVIGICFCLMSLLPSVSHDYKLIIHIVPFLLLLTRSASDLFDNATEAYLIVILLSASVAFIFVPMSQIIPQNFYNPALQELTQMKTTGLLSAFFCYVYLVVRGASVPSARQVQIVTTIS